MKTRINPVFISHGGGPMPLLGDPSHREMVDTLERLGARLGRPDAIVVVSAHWEEKTPAITASETPSLIYDYHGFPEESYFIEYPCPGERSLANEMHFFIDAAGLDPKLDRNRGLDHGVFVPLKIMYPEADIPCVQLSLMSSLDPEKHMALGEALRGLERENILLIGSGFSFHNLKAFFGHETAESSNSNREFEQWLNDVCCNANYSAEQRRQKLLRWFEVPGARVCHPREEHLLPLHVCAGAASGEPAEVINLRIMNKASSMYVW